MPDGDRAVGNGFLVSDLLVATSQHWLAVHDRPAIARARLEIGLHTGPRAVAEILLPESPPTFLALLRLTEPVAVTPLRLGYANIVRIGDCVWAAGPAPETDDPYILRRSVIDALESFPEQDLHLFKTGLRLPPYCSGSPLFNELGEVVGILTIREQNGGTAVDGAFAVAVDALDPLLARVGFDRISVTQPGTITQ